MWFIHDSKRLKSEVEGIEELRDNSAWFIAATNRMLKGLNQAEVTRW